MSPQGQFLFQRRIAFSLNDSAHSPTPQQDYHGRNTGERGRWSLKTWLVYVSSEDTDKQPSQELLVGKVSMQTNIHPLIISLRLCQMKKSTVCKHLALKCNVMGNFGRKTHADSKQINETSAKPQGPCSLCSVSHASIKRNNTTIIILVSCILPLIRHHFQHMHFPSSTTLSDSRVFKFELVLPP